MSKVTLTQLAQLTNQTSAITQINQNTAAIQAAFDNTVSRDGSTPNQMEAPLDMNSNRVLNLPIPVSPTEPIRFGEGATKDWVASLLQGITAAVTGLTSVSVAASIAVVTVPAPVVAFQTFGYATTGDGGQATYREVSAQPSHDAWVKDKAGRIFEIFGQSVNVKALGALGDNSTDDTSKIQAAYVACGHVGAQELYFPVGRYICDSLTFSLYNDFTFRGEQRTSEIASGSVIVAKTGTGDTWTIHNVGNVVVDSIGFDYSSALAPLNSGGAISNVARSSGAYLKFDGCNSSGTNDVSMVHGYDGLTTTGSGLMKFTGRLDIRNFNGRGIFLSDLDHVFDYVIMDQDVDTYTPLAGIYGEHGAGDWHFKYANILHTDKGVWFNPDVAQYISWAFFDWLIVDFVDWTPSSGSGAGVSLTPHNGGAVYGCMVTNLWIGTCPTGIQTTGDSLSKTSSLIVSNIKILNCAGAACDFDYIDHLKLANVAIAGNSTASTGTHPGILVGAHVSDLSVIGGYIGGVVENFPTLHSFGIVLNASFTGTLTVVGVDLRGNSIAAIYPARSSFAEVGAEGSAVVACPGYNVNHYISGGISGVSTQTVPGSGDFTHQVSYGDEIINVTGGSYADATIKMHSGDTPLVLSTGSDFTIRLPPRSYLSFSTIASAPTMTVCFA